MILPKPMIPSMITSMASEKELSYETHLLKIEAYGTKDQKAGKKTKVLVMNFSIAFEKNSDFRGMTNKWVQSIHSNGNQTIVH